MADHNNMTKEQARERLWKMDDAYIATVDGQILWGRHLSRFSPLASYVYASTTLAQTGLDDYKDYRLKLSHWNRQRVREGYSSEFVYQPLTLGQSLSEIGIDVVLLMVWNVLLFMSANVAFLRYDVR